MAVFVLAHPCKSAVFLGVFLAGLLLATIFQMNALTALVYHMGDQEKQVELLKDQGTNIGTQHLPSFSRIKMEALAKEMQFERVKQVSYLRVLGSSVAATTIQE